MRTITIITIMAVSFVSGCADYSPNPEATRIRTEWDIMLQETSELQPVVEDWLERHSQFLASLTNEQLRAYDEWCSETGTEAAKLLKTRKLRSLMSDSEWQILTALAEESAYGWGPKAQNLVDRQQSLERQWEEAKQNARYEYQQSQLRQAQNQRMLQQYYQQQRLQQSLSGIENAIRNQNSGITVIP